MKCSRTIDLVIGLYNALAKHELMPTASRVKKVRAGS